ncbi:hypothetical protein Acy02nite_39650 [Actinoplanes cyaneus]|uniref:IPT/TIG domain-containing protein n=1 Tax=Actinoplanes cyaneus TaxID=52696 RepID=A0A919IHU7_9ACTN|nr:IPT/TIG domain-containing protein [Actinoplanes cyaneus]MCW2139551.1 IPT/TIG domain-containing protein [Actinoplanes cyaneus]GID66084.1 hypothetical protein Acy02nite_39650 [Actinoplanes cyaneus]
MRKSKSRSKARLAAAAGLTTGAVGAALLAAPTAAFAAVTVSPPVVAVGGRVTITDTDGVTFVTGSTTAANRVMILTAPGTTTPVCAATIPVASTTILTATVAESSNVTKTVTFDMPIGATAGTSGQAKRYVACVYDTVGGTTARHGAQNGYSVNVGTVPTLNPALGLTGGGNTVGVTASTSIFSGVTTVGGQFATGECPATYGTPAAGLSTTVTKTGDAAASVTVPSGVTSTASTPTPYNLCFYNGAAATSLLISGALYSASQLSLSQTIGSWQGGTSLDITSPNPFLAGVDAPGVLFTSAASCPTDYDYDTGTYKYPAADKVRKVSNNRLAIATPTLFYADQPTMTAAATAAGSSSVPWNMCVYNGTVDNGDATSSDLVASNPYRVTTIQTATGISPKAGPALGGSLITVTGTNFPTEPGAITASLGGSPLTDITPISSTAFTARTPMHAPTNNAALTVTTAAGSYTMPTQGFAYTSALVTNPKTAPNTRAVDVVVNGVGFESATWGATLTTGAHIFLGKGPYSNAAVGGGTARANPPVADCGKVLVLSDTELVCKLDLTKRLNAAGDAVLASAPKFGAALTIGTTTGSRVLTAAAATFDQTDVGKAVVDTAVLASQKIPAGTTIQSVVSDTEAIMSNPASGTVANSATIVITGTNYRTAAMTTSSGANSLAAAGTGNDVILTTDVGKWISGAGILPASIVARTSGTVGALTDVAAAAANATASATVTTVITSGNSVVPEGSYNLQYVSNAALNSVHTDPAYVQSSISSNSTFTVASF